LVDCDLRRPDLHRVFTLGAKHSGLTDLLAGDHLNGHGVTQPDLPNLTVVSAGTIAGNPADLPGSQRMRSALAHMRDRADVVLLDSPPVLAVPDAAVLAAAVDGVVLVVDPKSSRRRDVKRACQTIEAVGGRILGVVINRLDPRGSLSGYHYDSRYGYGEAEPPVRPAFLRSRHTNASRGREG
jgi:capsular exopolysaccharide synthesis family protein